MKTIYVIFSESTSWNSITGESTVHMNIEKAVSTEDAAKEYCKERNTSHISYGYYDYESCELED